MRALLLLLGSAAAFAQSVSIVSGNGQVLPSNWPFEPLAVQVRTAAGQPAPGVTVTWTVVDSSADGRVGNFETTATSITDTSGIATIAFWQNPLRMLGVSFQQSRVTAAALGAAATFTETTSFVDFLSGVELVNAYPLFPSERITAVSGTVHPAPFQVEVFGATGGPVPGVAVTVLEGDQSRQPSVMCVTAPGQQPGTVLTDATGVATCNLRFSGPPGESTFRVRVGGNWRSYPATPLLFTVTPGAQSYTLQPVSGGNQTGVVGTTFPLAMIAQVRDAAGNGVANQQVVWELAQGGGTFSATNNTSDQFGRVWTNFTPSLAGQSQIRARLANNANAQALFTVTANSTTPGCAYSLAPAALSVPLAGQTGSASLETTAGCPWNVQSSAAWIQVTSAAAGSGPATITFSIAPNTGPARTGAISAGGRSLTITQAGAGESGCSFSVTPAELNPPPTGATGTITLDTTGTCAWTAAWDSPWLIVTPPAGSGPAVVSYTVYPNFGSRTRIGRLTAAGQTITVTQPGSFGTAAGRFVSQVYFSFFGRIPSPAELNFNLGALNTISRAQLVQNFFNSAEFSAGGRFVAGLYVGLLNRDPEFSGWLFNRNALSGGAVNHSGAVANFLNSAEFQLRYGTLTDTQFVQLLYTQVLLRAPAAAEVEFMLAALRAGMTRVEMASNFLNSPEFRAGTGPRLTAFALYATLLMRDPTAAERQTLINQIQSGVGVGVLIQPLLESAEFEALLQ